jgi:hypothetical protein
MDGAEDLIPAVQSELAVKGYTREELLAASHSLIAVK